ncbi:uncharacterized protein MONBRDRAFT_21799 [Monosiga brevicollis MX1]|uniref:Uncharacterized protein n=1 Tax=Monosiga brevicollis TaxID=81824 RepID=A9UNM8_MONBE|nr:uncharacterized protein MONBRDRAFT_21799 [Monosiga brevicollis MX1]EDQ92269.1 predicted protein [Monosiga brevicollis MX1]|eukprot:XP_001742031.1 hypothetical protein [Monosiga brevicollis MX1]
MAEMRDFLLHAKLKQASQTSALLSGFALVAMVELDLPTGQTDIDKYDDDPGIIAFAIITTLLISVHLFALMVSTCILPYLDERIERRRLHKEAQRATRDQITRPRPRLPSIVDQDLNEATRAAEAAPHNMMAWNHWSPMVAWISPTLRGA